MFEYINQLARSRRLKSVRYDGNSLLIEEQPNELFDIKFLVKDKKGKDQININMTVPADGLDAVYAEIASELKRLTLELEKGEAERLSLEAATVPQAT